MSVGPQDEGAITRSRRELKYRVELEGARHFARELKARLKPHRYSGQGANTLPGADHFVTTVYLDTADEQLYEAAREADGSVATMKIRAKEYYDRHTGLAQFARSQAQMVRSAPVLWFELKRSAEGFSSKLRAGVAKRDLARLLRDANGDVRMQLRALGDSIAPEFITEVEALGAALKVSVIVNYRRSAWQSADAQLRVTVDRELGFFAPRGELFEDDAVLTRERLGAPFAGVEGCIVEVKSLGEPADWLSAALREAGCHPVPFSKFVAAGDAKRDDAAPAKPTS